MSKRLVRFSSGEGVELCPTRCQELQAVNGTRSRRRLERNRSTRPPSKTGGNSGLAAQGRVSPAPKQGQARTGLMLAGLADGEYLPSLS